MVGHMDMARQQRPVGNENVIAQLAVVGHMAVAHQEVIFAQPGDAIFLFRATVDGNSFTECVAIANLDRRVGTAVAGVLRFGPDDDMGINDVIVANGDIAHQRNMADQSGAAADFCSRANGAEWTNFDFVIDFRSWVDPGVCCDAGCHLTEFFQGYRGECRDGRVVGICMVFALRRDILCRFL